MRVYVRACNTVERDNCHRLTLRSLRPDLLSNFRNMSDIRISFRSSGKLNVAAAVRLIFDRYELSPCKRISSMRTPQRRATKYRSEPLDGPIYHLGWPDLIVPRCTNLPIPTQTLTVYYFRVESRFYVIVQRANFMNEWRRGNRVCMYFAAYLFPFFFSNVRQSSHRLYLKSTFPYFIFYYFFFSFPFETLCIEILKRKWNEYPYPRHTR